MCMCWSFVFCLFKFVSLPRRLRLVVAMIELEGRTLFDLERGYIGNKQSSLMETI